MGKRLFIAEKPSVAREFASVLGVSGRNGDGFLESDDTIVTWCVGHLITMSYPDKYDAKLKRWSLETLPFLPSSFLYEPIESSRKQYDIIAGLLNRPDVDTIYVCTDSGREGEYIYRLVEQEAHVTGKKRLRVWIDSQTEEEIRRGIAEAKDLSAYDNLSASAYLRAQEDYLMGINFSRVLTLRYGPAVAAFLRQDRAVISVGRVMTCVLGMVVSREREIRSFVKTPFYRVIAAAGKDGAGCEAEWRVQEQSRYAGTPHLYKENGFTKREDAEELIRLLQAPQEGDLPGEAGTVPTLTVESVEKKKEKKNPPLLFNLAELQNTCSRRFKISPDQTLQIVQELYERKLVTYPRTDARVLSTAVAKEIDKNIRGLKNYGPMADFADDVLARGSYKGIAKTRYVNDKQITDHYAIIPTGQGFGALKGLSRLQADVYDVIARRFLSIFFDAAEYSKVGYVFTRPSDAAHTERFYASFKALIKEGYLAVAGRTDAPKDEDGETELTGKAPEWKKGEKVPAESFTVKEGETSPPKRYNSGSLILAMENAGQLIEDEELREQIKGSGIGTSATRAEILKKLVSNGYLALNAKTQIITPTLLGEMIRDVVYVSMRQMLNPELTASWEKGLSYVQEGTVTPEEYRQKLDAFVRRRTDSVKTGSAPSALRPQFEAVKAFYPQAGGGKTGRSSGRNYRKKTDAH